MILLGVIVWMVSNINCDSNIILNIAITKAAPFYELSFFFCKQRHFGLYLVLLILRSGDVETNPGPPVTYTQLLGSVKKFPKNVKFFHINCRSLCNKRNTIKKIINDLGDNTVYGFTETWLSAENNHKIWEIDSEQYTSIRCDRSDTQKGNAKKGGGVMLLIPNKFKPKKIKINVENHEHVLAKMTINNCNFLVHLSYNSSKNTSSEFLEFLAKNIDTSVVQQSNLILMGDYNINYLNHREKQMLDTILIPYGLKPSNVNENTMKTTNSLIDYVIVEDGFKTLSTIISDTPIKTDHYAQLVITDSIGNKKANPIIKTVFCKKNYSKTYFQKLLSTIDWSNMYIQSDAENMFLVFRSTLEKIIYHVAPPKKVFIRNDKPKKIKTDQDINELFSMEMKDRKKWQIINDTRNSKITSNVINCLRNSFGDVVTESVKMANLLNYKFATLGDFKTSFPHKGDVACRNENFIKNLDSNFNFRFITKFECLRTIKTLNPNKPLGPTSIPAWVLKDGAY